MYPNSNNILINNSPTSNNDNNLPSHDDYIQMRNRSNTWPLQPSHLSADLPAYTTNLSNLNNLPYYSQNSVYSDFNGSMDSGTASSSFSNLYYNNSNSSVLRVQQQNAFNSSRNISLIVQRMHENQQNNLAEYPISDYKYFKQDHLISSPSNSPSNSPMSFSFASTSLGTTIDSNTGQHPVVNFFGIKEIPSSSSHNSHSSPPEFNNTIMNENIVNKKESFEREDNNLLMKKKRNRGKTEETPKRKTNPWGEESYSELIEKALNSALDKKLKLNQIYDWFVNNLEYFRKRSTNEEGYGWKVDRFPYET